MARKQQGNFVGASDQGGAAFASSVQVRRAWDMLWLDFVQPIPGSEPQETVVVARVVLDPSGLDGLIERLTEVRGPRT